MTSLVQTLLPPKRRIAMVVACILALAATPGASLATQLPMPGVSDPRVRMVDYAPDDVVLITATLGYAVTLDFGDEERIETVSVGDGLNWQLTPNRRANLLFVKPMAAHTSTNMTVVTNLRVYQFELRARPRSGARRDRQVIFAVRFSRPAPAVVAAASEPAPAPPPEEKNTAYSYDGSPAALPVKVFDDGTSTYFKFAEATDIPAIVAVERDGKEALVNIANRDGYVVADRVAASFVLRRGAIVTRVFNDAFLGEVATPTDLRRHERHGRARETAPPAPPAATVPHG